MKGALTDLHARKPHRWPSTARRPFDRGVICADLALGAAVASVVGLFALSPVTLEGLGIAYMSSGGGLLAKVHPSTLLAIAALAFRCLSARRPLAAAWRLVTIDAGAMLLLLAFVITALYAVRVSQTPVTPLVDTFALPALVFLLLRDLDRDITRALAVVVGLIFCANAVIALIEFLRHWHLVRIPVPEGVSADPRRSDVTFDWRAQLANDWRATALLGHPLTNGLATGALILCLFAGGTDWLRPVVKAPVIALQAAAMLAFGARTALVLTIGLSIWLGGGRLIAFVRDGQRLRPASVCIALVAIAVGLIAIAVLVESGLADQTIARFQDDQGSATTRLTMFNLFGPLSWSDILLGPDPDQLTTQRRLEGLEFGIESSWIGLLLSYGLLVTAAMMTGLAVFARSIVRTCGAGAGVVILFFVVQVSTAASLSTKTTILAITVALVLLFLQKEQDIDARTHRRPKAA